MVGKDQQLIHRLFTRLCIWRFIRETIEEKIKLIKGG